MPRTWLARPGPGTLALAIALTLALPPPALPALDQAGAPAARLEPPRFADPARRTKLRGAFAAIDRAFVDFTTREHVPGAAWGIVIDGELAHTGVTGYRELSSRAAVEPDTVFRIASMTKSFTAMAILALRDDGKLSLDDPVDRYVPELKGLVYPTSDSPRVTIRHLLSHAEGFPEDNPWGDQQLAATDEELSAMLRAGIPFSNAPGVAYEYSNLGFAILGRVVANVGARPYPAHVAATILQPLGMTATTLEPQRVPPARLAHGYRWEDEQWKEEPQLPDGAFGPMGGMLTSIRDLARYVSVFVAAWPPRDGPEPPPLRRASLREMQQVARPRPATVSRRADGTTVLNAGGYGFGLGISETCAFAHVVAHSGGLPGFGSQMRWLPEYGVGLIALGNRTYTGWGGPFAAALDLLDQTGGLQRRLPQPSPALTEARDAVSRLIVDWDDALADRIAAGNLYLDRSKARRRAEIEALAATVGRCRPDAAFTDVENALRGTWSLACDRGEIAVAVTLAPTIPPRVQHLEVAARPPAARAACQP